MKLFTIGYIDHNRDVHNKYLQKSIDNLKGEFNVISTSDKECPARNYNTMISMCDTKYLILVHQDITFTPNILSDIHDTIRELPVFGAIGYVGANSNGITYSEKDRIKVLDTIDACFIVLNMNNNLLFDDVVFNDYHLYVEDYCARLNKEGLPIITIKTDKDSISHHSSTCRELGWMWGRYKEYKQIFNNLHKGFKTT